MNRLNFGCGVRVATGWTNIDFHPADANVARVNLLGGFPYADNSFDAVYSSHVLEHFTRDQAQFLLGEARRVLKPGGVLRIVVPDLESSCSEYLYVLALPDNHPAKRAKYEWILIELIDQLVRTVPSGEMGPFIQRLRLAGHSDLLEYVRSRTENSELFGATPISVPAKVSRTNSQFSFSKLFLKLNYWHLRIVGSLLPKSLRSMVFVETSVGERHRWMYDAYGLRLLLTDCGFADCRLRKHNESDIEGFLESRLDSNADGTSYKNMSVFMECSKAAITSQGLTGAPHKSVWQAAARAESA